MPRVPRAPDLDAAIARHYARDQEGLPPPAERHAGFPSLEAKRRAHIEWLMDEYRLGRLPVQVPPPLLPDSPPEE